MTLGEIKSNVDLPAYARERYGLNSDSRGRGSCPFHPPDNNASFSFFKGQDGVWRWKCHHDGSGGTIVDLAARMDGISDKEAIDRLMNEHRPEQAPRAKPEVIREHVYCDGDGKAVFRKTKLRVGSKTDWRLDHNDAGAWRPGKNGRELIPYRLDLFKNFDSAIIAEGEKDADTINGLGLDLFATSAPTGCSSWPDSITPYFGRFKEVAFLYDVGNDSHVEKHAAKLSAAFPDMSIKIAKVPGIEREFDITDYLADEPAKGDAMLEILAAARPFPAIDQPIIPPPSPRITDVLEIENTFLNNFVSSIIETTDAPRIFILFSGIALLSGIANKFFFYFPRKTHLNLYLLLLAPSTYCRKSTCTDIVGDYLRDINPELLLPESFTPEALFDILQVQPRGLIIWRELIQVKEFMFGSEYSKGLPAFLTDAYDYKAEYKRWTKGEGQIRIENPIVSILAAGIASWFVKNLCEIDFQGGIWTRFLFVPAPDQVHRYRLPQKFTLDPMIKGRMMTLNDRPGEEIDLSVVRPLIQIWGEQHMEQSLRLDNGILQAVFLRLEVMLLKLAALFQLAQDGQALVQELAFRDAERVIEFIKRRLPPFFNEEVQFTPFDQARAKIEKFLKTKGQSSKGDILRYTHINTTWANKILDQLQEEQRVRLVDVPSSEKRGKPTRLYAYVSQ